MCSHGDATVENMADELAAGHSDQINDRLCCQLGTKFLYEVRLLSARTERLLKHSQDEVTNRTVIRRVGRSYAHLLHAEPNSIY